MDPLDIANIVEVNPCELEFEEHQLEEQLLEISNYFEDVDIAYRIHSSIPNTFIFRVASDVVPSSYSCEVPVAIKSVLPPDYMMIDAISAKITIELVPNINGELDSVGSKAFWSIHSRDAAKMEIGCMIYKAGAVRPPKIQHETDEQQEDASDIVTTSEDVEQEPVFIPQDSSVVKPVANLTHGCDLGSRANTPTKNKGLSVSFTDESNNDIGDKKEVIFTTRGANSNQQAMPQVVVKPKTIHFLEGDEPLLASILIRNTGASPCVFRVSTSTPLRFLLSIAGGVLNPTEEREVSVELRSFPAHSPPEEGSNPFASFFVDFANFSENFSISDAENFFNGLEGRFVRKMVSGNAVSYDNRSTVEKRLNTQASDEAPTDDVYSVYSEMSASEDRTNSLDQAGCLFSDSEDGQRSPALTPRSAAISLDQSRYPNTTVTPTCLYFLEGDEPLADTLHIHNTGIRAVLYRIKVTTANRFLIAAPFGELEADGRAAVPIELRSFPIQLPESGISLATISIDFALRDGNYTSRDMETYWSDTVSNVFVRKTVACRAVAYDNRSGAEEARVRGRGKSAATDYNGYAMAAANGTLIDSKDIVSASALATIFERGESILSVGCASLSFEAERPHALLLEKSSLQEQLTDSQSNECHSFDEFSHTLGNLTADAEMLPGLKTERPTFGASRHRRSVRNVAPEMASEDEQVEPIVEISDHLSIEANRISLGDAADVALISSSHHPSLARSSPMHGGTLQDVLQEQDAANEAKWSQIVNSDSYMNAHDDSEVSERRGSLSVGSVANVTIAATRLRPAPLSRRHSVDIDVSDGKVVAVAAQGMASVLSEFSRRSNSGNLQLKRRASTATGSLPDVKHNLKRSEMSSVLNEFSHKLNSGKLQLRRSSIVSQAEKKRQLREEETNGKFNGVLGELRFLFSVSNMQLPDAGAPLEDFRSYNTRGEMVDDGVLEGFTTVRSIDKTDQQDSEDPTNICGMSEGDEEEVAIDEEVGRMIHEDDDIADNTGAPENTSSASMDDDELFPDSPFSSPVIRPNKFITQPIALVEASDPAVVSPNRDRGDRVRFEEKFEEIAESLLKKDKLLQEKNARIEELNEQIDILVSMQLSSNEEVEANRESALGLLTKEYEIKISVLKSEFDGKMSSLQQRIDLQQEEHKLEILSINNQNIVNLKDTVRMKDAAMRALTYEIEELRSHQESTEEERSYKREANIRKLNSQHDSEINSLKRLLEETKEENELNVATLHERHQSELKMLAQQHESDICKRQQNTDFEINKLTTELEELKLAKEVEIGGLRVEKDAKIKSLTNHYELELKALRRQVAHLEALDMDISRNSEELIHRDDGSQRRIKLMEIEISMLKSKVETLREEKNAEVIHATQRFEEELAELKVLKDRELSLHCLKQEEKTGALVRQLQQARVEWQEEVQDMSAQRENDISFLSKQHEAKLNIMVQHYELRVSALLQQQEIYQSDGLLKQQEELISALTAAKDAEIKTLSKQYEAKSSAQNQQYETKIGALSQQIESIVLEKESELRELGQQKDAKIRALMKQQAVTVGSLTQQLEDLSVKVFQQENDYATSGASYASNVSSGLVSHLKDQLQQQEDRITSLQEENRQLERKVSSVHQQKESDLRALTKQHENKNQTLAQQLVELNDDHASLVATLKQQHEAELRSYSQKHDNEIASLNLHKENKLDSVRKRHEEDIIDLKQQHEIALDVVSQQKDDETRLLTRQFEAKQKALLKQLEQLTQQLKQDMSSNQIRLDEELATQARLYEREITAKEKIHSTKVASLVQQQDLKVLSIRQELEDSYLSRETELVNENNAKEAKLRAIIQQHEAEIVRLKYEVEALMHQQSVTESAYQQQKGSEFRLVQKRHEGELSSLATQLEEQRQKYEDEVMDLKEQFENQLRLAANKQEADISKLQHEHGNAMLATLQRLEDEAHIHSTVVASMQLQKESELNFLVKQNEARIFASIDGEAAKFEKWKEEFEQKKDEALRCCEETLRNKHVAELAAKDEQLEIASKKAERAVDECKKEADAEKESLKDNYEAQIEALNRQLDVLSAKVNSKELGTFMTQSDDPDDAVESPRAVALVQVSPNILSFAIGEAVSEDFILVKNNSDARIAFRTRVSVQNMFVVRGGDGLIDGGQSVIVSISSKPTVLYGSTDELPSVKFAVELLEVDDNFNDNKAREYWKDNSTFSIRHSLTTRLRADSASPDRAIVGSEDLNQAREMNSLLNNLKSRLASGSISYNSPREANVQIKKFQHAFAADRNLSRPLKQAPMNIGAASKPTGRVFDLLLRNLSSQNPLSADEFEELQAVRNRMTPESWEEWVQYAQAKKKTIDSDKTERLISELEEKEYRADVLRLSQSKLQPSPPAAHRSRPFLKETPLIYSRNMSSGRAYTNADVPSNNLAWSDMHNNMSPPPIAANPTSGPSTGYASKRTESPLVMAKALVSTINSEFTDMGDIKSKLSMLENVVNVMGSDSARNKINVTGVADSHHFARSQQQACNVSPLTPPSSLYEGRGSSSHHIRPVYRFTSPALTSRSWSLEEPKE